MNFLRRITKNFRNNQVKQSAGEATVNTLKNIISTKIKLTLAGPIILFVVGIVVVLLSILTIFDYDIQLLGLADPNAGQGDSNVGNLNYTEADFEDAVKITNNAILTSNITDFAVQLQGTNYSTLEKFNELIKSNVQEAGYGTREGVVTAAMTLSYEYTKLTGHKLFYQYPGMRENPDGVTQNTFLDCRGFVFWALYNGGFKADQLHYITTFSQWGQANGLVKSDVKSVKPGDIFSTDNTGHIWLVVGVYDDGYYAAEEYGYNNGLVINKIPFSSAYHGYSAKLYDMSSYYSNSDNVR